jgi:hypothetical protein
MKVKEVAPDYPAINLILTLTSDGKKVTAREVRQILKLSAGQLNSQLGQFTLRVEAHIAPEWASQFPRSNGMAGWHWPLTVENPIAGGSLIYSMPEQVRTIWRSI